MRYSIVILLFLVSATAGAQEIFRYLDDKGNVVFSNTPPPGVATEPVKLSPINAVGAGASLPQQAEDAVAPGDAFSYTRFEITEPRNEVSVRANDGNVTISVAVDPPLRDTDKVALYLDGKKVAEGRYSGFVLQNVFRGTHEIHAEIRDSEGKVLKSTGNISFTVQRVAAGGG